MTGKLLDEIRQTRPFGTLAQEAYLGVLRTAALLDHAVAEALKPHGITPTQYNVLRILRGAHPDGYPRGEIASRLIERAPDVTRLIDRLEREGLVERARSSSDRRLSVTRITAGGLDLLERLDLDVNALHDEISARLSRAEVRTLSGLLERLYEESGERER